MKHLTLSVVAAVLCAALPAAAQDFSYENCECIDGVRYCSQQTESYESVQDYQTPEYAPQQTYDTTYRAASYTTTYSAGAQDDGSYDLALAFLLLLALIVLAESFSSSPSIEQDINETQALTEKLEATAREADTHIARFLEQGGQQDDDHDA